MTAVLPEINKDGGERAQESSFVYLLAALLVLLALYPFHDGTLTANLCFLVINFAILIAGVFAASRSRKTLVVALALAIPALGIHWFHIVSGNKQSGDLMYIANIAFYSFTIFQVLVQVLRPGAVTGNKICGAIAAYILAAVTWAAIYGMINTLIPGSFVISGQIDKTANMTPQDFLFFSFTTLTTTGYGDIVPVSRHAQSLTILEQLAGIFYVAILIARLAGLYQPGAGRRPTRH